MSHDDCPRCGMNTDDLILIPRSEYERLVARANRPEPWDRLLKPGVHIPLEDEDYEPRGSDPQKGG